MANEGRQVVLRTLRSISRAKGRTSIVIMILLMLVCSECYFFRRVKFDQLLRECHNRSTQEVQLVFVHFESFLDHCFVARVLFQRVTVLNERFECFDDSVLWRVHIFYYSSRSMPRK